MFAMQPLWLDAIVAVALLGNVSQELSQ